MKYPSFRSFRTFIQDWFDRDVVKAIPPDEAEAQADAIKNGLTGVTPEVLVRAVFSLDTSEEAVAEAEDRLAKMPLANQFAFRLLVGWRKQEAGPLTAEEEADLDDAVDGLRRCCFAAIGDWSVPGDLPFLIYNREMGAWVMIERRDTGAFIEDRLLVELELHRKLSAQGFLTAALESRFKDLPAAVKCDLMDEFDKSNTRKARALKFQLWRTIPRSG
jgi:hypothetical protein